MHETAVFIESFDDCQNISNLLDELKEEKCSVNISEISDLTLIREENNSLNNIENVKKVPNTEIELYQKYLTKTSFILPLKVPKYLERHLDDGKHFTKSNLNVCYAAPRNKRKSRDWFETQ